MLCETYLKEEFSSIYSRFLLRQVRQALFSPLSKCSIKIYSKKPKYFKIISFFSLSRQQFFVKNQGGEELCRTYGIAFWVSGSYLQPGTNREPILQIAAIKMASNMAARAFSRCNKAQWVHVAITCSRKHRGKTSADAQIVENIAENLNPFF